MSDEPRVIDPDTDPFWAAVMEQRLVFGRCAGCDGVVFYLRKHCPSCGSDDVALVESAGRGVVYTTTVTRRHPLPALAEECPFTLALVDFDEGFRMLTRVLDAPEGGGHAGIGDRVEVAWHEHGGQPMPCVRRAGDAA